MDFGLSQLSGNLKDFEPRHLQFIDSSSITKLILFPVAFAPVIDGCDASILKQRWRASLPGGDLAGASRQLYGEPAISSDSCLGKRKYSEFTHAPEPAAPDLV